MPFEYRDHAADVEVRGIGTTIEEAFAAAAAGMFNVMVDLDRIAPQQQLTVTVSAPRRELLLVEWLGTLLGEKEISGLIFSRFVVEIAAVAGKYQLRGTAWGEKLNPARHRPKIEVKGVSYAGLRVETRDGKWIAQCVLDT